MAALLGRAAAAGLPAGPATRELPVASDAQLAEALAAAEPGDHIVLEDGSYATSGEFRLVRGGTVGRPVVLRAARPLAARLAGPFTVDADDVVVTGLRFTSGSAVGGDRLHVLSCSFDDTDEGIALNVGRGQDVTVAYCAFVGCRGRGLSIDPSGKADKVRGTHAHHNLFKSFVGRAGQNAHEALQIGQGGVDALLRVGAVVEDNLFLDVSVDSETISVKSSDNTIRRNTFRDCRSRPTNRFGNDNRWHANWIESSHGIWIYGAGHELAGNRIIDSRDGIAIMAGNAPPLSIRGRALTAKGELKVLRPHCQDVRVVGNEADRLIIGKVIEQSGEAYTMPAVGTRIAGHVGPIELELEQDTRIDPAVPAGVPVAARLDPKEVGPEAA